MSNTREEDTVVPQQVDLRMSHPGLFRLILTSGCVGVALALNFWTSSPTFNPYGWDKNIVGVVFAVTAVSLVIALTVAHNLRAVRVTLTASFMWTAFWGVANTRQSFAGDASYQLPILLIGAAVIQFWLLLEAPVNPLTRKK